MSVESNPGLNWFCFTVLFDWPRKLAPPSQPIRCKLKPIAPWSLAFSRATGRLHAFTSSCHWLPLIISFTLIGRCDYFGFGLVFDTQLKSALYISRNVVEKKCTRQSRKVIWDRSMRYVLTLWLSNLLFNLLLHCCFLLGSF